MVTIRHWKQNLDNRGMPVLVYPVTSLSDYFFLFVFHWHSSCMKMLQVHNLCRTKHCPWSKRLTFPSPQFRFRIRALCESHTAVEMYSYTQQSAVLRAACELLHRKTKWKGGRKNWGTYISNSEEEKPRSKKKEREKKKRNCVILN